MNGTDQVTSVNLANVNERLDNILLLLNHIMAGTTPTQISLSEDVKRNTELAQSNAQATKNVEVVCMQIAQRVEVLEAQVQAQGEELQRQSEKTDSQEEQVSDQVRTPFQDVRTLGSEKTYQDLLGYETGNFNTHGWGRDSNVRRLTIDYDAFTSRENLYVGV